MRARIFLSIALALRCITLQGAAFSQEYRGTWEQQRACTPMSGGCAARKYPMQTGSWLAYGEIHRNSAMDAAQFLNKGTMRPHVVRIANMGKGVMMEILSKGATIEIMGLGVMTENTAKALWL